MDLEPIKKRIADMQAVVGNRPWESEMYAKCITTPLDDSGNGFSHVVVISEIKEDDLHDVAEHIRNGEHYYTVPSAAVHRFLVDCGEDVPNLVKRVEQLESHVEAAAKLLYLLGHCESAALLRDSIKKA